jgi:hypothetical protein
MGGKTWSFILRKEHRLRMFENRMPRTQENGSNGRMEKIA